MRPLYPVFTLLVLLTGCKSNDTPTPASLPAAPTEANLQLAWQYAQQSRTQTMLVMHDGKIIFEQYANGGSATKPQLLASGTKSFNGVVAEAAVEDGLIRLDNRVADVLTEWKNDPRKAKITYRQLLTLTSGLTPGEANDANKLPGWDAILAEPMIAEPGTTFAYGSHQFIAFAAALQRKLGSETYESYLKRRILDPLGINLVWGVRCADGNPQVAGGAFMTARNWATFGEWVRREGDWNGRQIVARNRLAECFIGTSQNPAYGLTWWLREPVTSELIQTIPLLRGETGGIVTSTYLPDDLVMAAGAGKQRLYIIPSLKLVAVRQGPLQTTDAQYSDVEFLSRLLRGKADGE